MKASDMPRFSAEVAVLLDELDTAREVVKINSTRLVPELERFTKGLMEHIYESLPDKAEWDREFKGYYRDSGLVVFMLRRRTGKSPVEIRVALYDPLNEDLRWHPGVCLLLRSARRAGAFVPHIESSLPKDWTSASSIPRDQRQNYEEGALSWANVPYENFRSECRFDTRAFVERMTRKALEAVDLVPVVEGILRGLK